MKHAKSLTTLSLIALAATGLTSCSNNEEVLYNDGTQDSNRITYSVNYTPLSRSATSWGGESVIDQFTVWAYYEEGGEKYQYFADDVVSLTKNTITSTSGADTYNGTGTGTQYWPSETTKVLNFLALADFESNTFSWTGSSNAFSPNVTYTGAKNATNQHDILYAIKLAQTKSTNSATVAMNFRHALSNVVFKAKVTKADIRVTVRKVYLHNFYNTGVFTFQTEKNTDLNSGDSALTWSSLGKSETTNENNIEATFDTGTKENLISTTETDALPKTGDILVIPFNYTTSNIWNPSDSTRATDRTKVYLSVDCKIEHEEMQITGTNAGQTVWKSVHEGEIYLPVQFNFEQGKKYTYTLVYGDGNYGYDENNDPVMVPISYEITNDTWGTGFDNADINVQTN